MTRQAVPEQPNPYSIAVTILDANPPQPEPAVHTNPIEEETAPCLAEDL